MIDSEELLRGVLALDPDLRRERYYGEDAVFYNPGASAPLGRIVAAVKHGDGPNDRAARLSRPGVYRFAFAVRPETFARRFGPAHARPAKGGVVELDGYDPTRLNALMPHPVYGWMNWVQVLSPTPARYAALRPLVAESLGLARAKWDHSPDAARR